MVSFQEKPLVSVITPFYNTAAYLDECIGSVFGQSYTNWEYILVDNRSTDGGGEIARKYAANEARIRFIKESEFVGQVDNYNRALRYISPESKYCKIVQADDWIYPHCLDRMVEAAESGKNVGLISSLTLYGNSLYHTGLSPTHGPVYAGRQAARMQLLGTTLFGSPTGVMYLSDLIRQKSEFFSPHTPYFEDTEVCFKILKNHDFAFVPELLTFNRCDNNGIWSGLRPHNPDLLCEIMFIHLFGPDFLEPDELTGQIRSVEKRYYDFLTQHALRRDADFWEFHRKGLNRTGQRVQYSRIVLRLCRAALRRLIRKFSDGCFPFRRRLED